MNLPLSDPRMVLLLSAFFALLFVLFVILPWLFIWKAKRLNMIPQDWHLSSACVRVARALGSELRRNADSLFMRIAAIGVIWGIVVAFFGFKGGHTISGILFFGSLIEVIMPGALGRWEGPGAEELNGSSSTLVIPALFWLIVSAISGSIYTFNGSLSGAGPHLP